MNRNVKRRAGYAAVMVVPVVVVALLAALIAVRHVTGRGVYTAPPPGRPVQAGLAPVRYAGVYEPGVPASYAPVAAFAQATGTKPGIALYYSSWWEPFPARFAAAARAHGAIPFAQMIPFGRGVSITRLVAGQYDGYLHTFAEQVRRYGHPVIIGFAPEMNGSWYRWGWHRIPPALWVRAWRHVVNVFRRQGARNVTWLWTINRDSGRHTGPIRDWWPGSTYVTWVGIDGYYFKPGATFRGTFGITITQVRAFTSKPVLLSETAIGPVAGQAAKIPGLFAGVRRNHLLGLVWFDKAQHRGVYHQDWRLEGHPAAIAAFRKGVTQMLGR